MARVTILKDNIDDNLWPKLILVITYIKNSQSTQTLKNISSYKVYFYKQPNLIYL